jgi:TolB-like protein
MGEVYLADDPLLGRSVALKVLARDVADDAERRAMFQREATSAAALNHPNICTIFEVGEADHRPYIAMEMIEGRTLAAMTVAGPLASDVVIGIALQIAEALEEARARNVVHRDLKGANILVTPKGTVKVLDFGLAKRVATASTSTEDKTQWLSHEHIISGTLPYMSPEQALGRVVDHRSDLFSFGTVLYEALTGTIPFSGPTSPEILNAVVNVEPPALVQVNPRVPRSLAAVVGKLMAKAPGDRYQSASDVIDDLRAIRQSGHTWHNRLTWSRPRLRGMVAAAAIVVTLGAAWTIWRQTTTVVGSIEPKGLVVVPATVTGPPQMEFLADAIANSLTTRLAAYSGVRMKVPPTSSEFARIGGNLETVSDSYGVGLCLVPKATVAGGRLRVNVQLVAPKGRDIVWSAEFESPLDRYDDAVGQAASGVIQRLTGQPVPASTTVASSTISALELAINRGLYYGRLFNSRYQQSDYDLARAAYFEALQLDPRSARAAAELAYLQIFKMQGGESPDRALPELDRWAKRAIEFDPLHDRSWAALAVAEIWRRQPDYSKQLEYAFRAASLGESCASCQLALVEAMLQFSGVLTHHAAQQSAALDPLSAYGQLNSSVALAALGRADEAALAIDRAAAIEPDALWVPLLRTLTLAAAGSFERAAAEADALTASDRIKTLPKWVPRLLDLTRAEAKSDAQAIARAVAEMREPARRREATLMELQYLTAIAAPMLARAGQAETAIEVLADVTAAHAPPPYDMLMLNSNLSGIASDPRARTIVARSRARFDFLINTIAEARTARRFPPYLEQPLRELLASLKSAGQYP